MDQTTKICRRCKQPRPLSDFYRSQRRSHVDGLHTVCKTCAGPEVRSRMLDKKYGITQAEYEAMLESQGSGCAICGGEKPYSMGSFMIDHDHLHHPLGEGCRECIRGLLCNRCNCMIQWLEDRWEIVHHYLERPRPLLPTTKPAP